MSDFHFLRPEWIFLILPLALLFFYKQVKPLKAGNWQNVIAPKLQQYVLFNQGKQSQSKVVSSSLWLAALLSVFALSGPSWERQESAVYRSSEGIVIGLDLSLSMTAQDTSPSRIQRAKYKIIDVLEQQQDKNIGLIAYAGDAHVVSPLTQDINTIKSMLPAVDPYIMPKQGSNILLLAERAVELFEQSNSQPRTLLLITDGVESSDIDAATDILNNANIQLNILAVGTEEGAPMMRPDGRFIKDSQGQVILPPLEWEALNQLASQSNGKIVRLSNTEADINQLMASTTIKQNFQKQEENLQFDQWLDSGYWLILPLLLLTLGAFRKGIVLSILICIALPPSETYAYELPDMLLNGDQTGAKYFEQSPEQAAQYFNDPKWKASSLYKAGKFEEALTIWQKFNDAQSLYNQGNALAQLHKIDEAIAAYDKAIKQQTEFENAMFNKALLEQLKDQQEQQEQQNQQGDQSQQDQQDSSEQQGDESKQQSSEKDSQGNSESSEKSESSDKQQADQKESQASEEDGNQASENPLNQAQTEEEKQREEEMQALKQEQSESSEEQEGSQKDSKSIAQQSEKTAEELEQEQAMQQWIQRIPDDPGGLLRNKFLYQYQQRQGQQEQNEERKPW